MIVQPLEKVDVQKSAYRAELVSLVSNKLTVELQRNKRYIVKMALSGESVPQDFIGFTELSRQLSLIGNNLNQLARKANTINNIYAEDYEQMRKEFNSLCLLLKQKISMLRRTAA